MAVNVGQQRGEKYSVDCSLAVLLQPDQLSSRQLHLFEAARKNDLAALEKVLSSKVQVNTRNNLDRTALHWAAANGNADAIETLMRASADVNSTDKYGMTPVLLAAWYGHHGAMAVLVKNKKTVLNCHNRQGMNALHCAALNDHINVLEFFHSNEMTGKMEIDRQDLRGKTPVAEAAERGHSETVDYLLTIGCNSSIADLAGRTPLHLAANGGHNEIVASLIRQNKDIVNSTDKDGFTALHLAAGAGHPNIVHQLISANADINATVTKIEATALMLAAIGGHVECASLLLREQNCQIDHQNSDGNTAVHLTALNNSVRVLRHLIGRGCNLNIANKHGQTPLLIAAEKGHSRIILLLLDNGADLTVKDSTGKTSLSLASRANCVAVVDMIIKADRLQKMLNIKDAEGVGRMHRRSLQDEINDQGSENEAESHHSSVLNIGQSSEDGPVTVGSNEAEDLGLGKQSPVEFDGTQTESGNRITDNDSNDGKYPDGGHPEVMATDASIPNRSSDDASSTTVEGEGHDTDRQKTTGSKPTERFHDDDDDDDDVFRSDSVDLEEQRAYSGGGGDRDRPSSIGSLSIAPVRSCCYGYESALKTILWKISTKELNPGEWKKLANRWQFTDEHIRAIEHQYTGQKSYCEHSYRMMLIWLDCYLELNPTPNGNPLRELYDGLAAIGKRKLAEQVRAKCNRKSESRKSCILS